MSSASPPLSDSSALPGSVSIWLTQIRDGDDGAVREIFNRYFNQLLVVARSQLKGFKTRIVDEEDFALDTLEEACRGFRQGRFESANDRGHLWAILLRVLRDIIVNHKRWELRKRRSVDRVDENGMPNELTDENDGADDVEILDQQRHLFDLLQDVELRQIAAARLEGYSNSEIAAQLNLSNRTVQRKIQIIYERWEKELGRFEF